MATVTGLTAERMLAIEGESVVDAEIIGDHLILTKHDGTQIDTGNVVGPQGPQGDPGDPGGAMSGTLAARPAAAASSGLFYYATDQAVLYLSDGAAWNRLGLPVGSTTFLPFVNAVAPTGYVRLDGTNLPSALGIYADIYALNGNSLVLPDTRARSLIDKGTNTVVDTIGKNDGVSIANRRGTKHRHTPHTHTYSQSPGEASMASGGVSVLRNPTTLTTGASDGGSGVSSDPLDGGAFYVGLLIAKL